MALRTRPVRTCCTRREGSLGHENARCPESVGAICCVRVVRAAILSFNTLPLITRMVTAIMILRSAVPSPFGRKVQIALSVLGMNDVKFEPADTMDPRDSVRAQNPIGKIPVLILEDGSSFYNSRVILEYLDHRAGGGKIIPRDPDQRFAALRLQALCDGILDASILGVYEGRWRAPEKHEPKWVEHQAGKVARGLSALESAPPALAASPAASPCRPDHAGLRARLSRFPLWRHLARRSSAACRVARDFRGAGARIRRDSAESLSSHGLLSCAARKNPGR